MLCSQDNATNNECMSSTSPSSPVPFVDAQQYRSCKTQGQEPAQASVLHLVLCTAHVVQPTARHQWQRRYRAVPGTQEHLCVNQANAGSCEQSARPEPARESEPHHSATLKPQRSGTSHRAAQSKGRRALTARTRSTHTRPCAPAEQPVHVHTPSRRTAHECDTAPASRHQVIAWWVGLARRIHRDARR
jgi:hypothetical protein